MDPNLIHLDWERAGEALTLIIVFAFVIERALAVVFENKIWVRNVQVDGLKELIALVASIAACAIWKFDAIGMLLLTETTTAAGYALTGAVIAGGSKASIKLFHDVLGIKSTAYATRHAQRAEKHAEDAEESEREAAANPTTEVVEAKLQKARASAQAAAKAATAASPDEIAVARAAVGRADAAVQALEQRLGVQP